MTSSNTPFLSIRGVWRSGQDPLTLTVLNPANAHVVGQFQGASPADIDDALQATVEGFAFWRNLTSLDRCTILCNAANLLRTRSAEMSAVLTREQGKTLAEAAREVEQAAQMVIWNAEEGRRSYGQTIPSRFAQARFHTIKEPIGPVAAFTPWNFPVMLSAMKVSAALAAGCSVILKPAEETPSAPALMVRCFHEAGVPGAVLQMLVGQPEQISNRLIASPHIRKVSFTGSTAVGRSLAALAGQYLKPITLELGGHAPAIICEDADMAQTAASLGQIKLRNAGQICANPSRFFVHRSRQAELVNAFLQIALNTVTGDGANPATTMGPLANRRRLKAVESLVEDARQGGARVLCGGQRLPGEGFFYLPTVLTDLSPKARILHEEPFGPLIPIVPFDTLEEAIALANQLPVGLAAFGFTNRLQYSRKLSEELRAGAVAINTVTLMQPETPFGGMFDSGYGRENGSHSLDAYQITRSVVTVC